MISPAAFVLIAPILVRFAVILQWDKPGMLVCNSRSTFESVLSANMSGVHTFVWMLSFVVVFVQFCID